MVLDTSALLAILFDEIERAEMIAEIAAADVRRISAATLLEANIVARSRAGSEAVKNLETLLELLRIDVEPFDRSQLAIAKDGFLTYGKGRHPAGLNFGDLFAYALSKAHGEPLLFKGDDFSATDVVPVRLKRD